MSHPLLDRIKSTVLVARLVAMVIVEFSQAELNALATNLFDVSSVTLCGKLSLKMPLGATHFFVDFPQQPRFMQALYTHCF